MKLIITLILSISIIVVNAQNVGINDDGSTPEASAILDVHSSLHNKGVLLPRMTNDQKNAISNPTAGLIIFQTDENPGFYYFDSSVWIKLSNDKVTFSTVAEAENVEGNDNDLCFVLETETYYRFEEDASSYSDDNRYVLSTGDGANTRWLGISGKYNLGDVALQSIEYIDATSGSASISTLNKVYYIQGASTATTITIPDANNENAGWFLRIIKDSGVGIINIQTTSGQLIGGDNPIKIIYVGQGFLIKSDNATKWSKIQDSRDKIPEVVSISSDYNADSEWIFDFLIANTNSSDINITLPSDISGFPEGDIRMFFNTGSNRLIFNPNSNLIDGLSTNRVMAPGGYIELQKINSTIKIVREKNITLEKNPGDINGLVCWLDASQLSGSDESSVASWEDLVNAYTFTASGSEQPILKLNEQNSKNIVRFDGSDDVLSAGDIELHSNTNGLTIVAVVKPENSARMPLLSKYKSVGNDRAFVCGNKNNYLFDSGSWNSRSSFDINMTKSKFQIIEYIWAPDNSPELYINGVLQDKGDNPVADLDDVSANLKLGACDTESMGFWDGDVAEVLIYNEAISHTEREALRNNLSIKWDIDEIILANGGAKYWKRDDDTNTIQPDVDNDNLNLGTGTLTTHSVETNYISVSDLLNVPTSATAPLSPQVGSIYYNTTDNKLKVYNGSTWDNLN
ncbi:MAG: hypothetical protein JXR60_00675 [Bacteroidales bacterium]|nr:hypothetical protein [Bacteroidales bacterium]